MVVSYWCGYRSRLPLQGFTFVFFLMIRRPPRSTLDRSSAASDVYKRQARGGGPVLRGPADDATRVVPPASGLGRTR